MVILPMLVALSANVDQVIARNAAYLAKAQSLSVQVEATTNKRSGKGAGVLLFKRPSSIAFDLKWGGEDYLVRANSKTVIELEKSSRMYAEHEPTGILRLPAPELSSGMAFAFPGMLLSKSVGTQFALNSKKSYVGQEKVAGILTDHIRAESSTQMAKIKIDAWVDEQGALRRYDIDVAQPGASFHDSLLLSNYKINVKTTEQSFAKKPPVGYVPYVFDQESMVVQGGQKLKLTGLAGNDGKPFDLAKWLNGKKALVVIAGPTCKPSEEMLSHLNEFSGSLRTLAILPKQRSGLKSTLSLVDKKGAAASASRTPSLPVIILVDHKECVAQVWIGFDKANIQQLASEIRSISAQIK